jgi:hypothetical protein
VESGEVEATGPVGPPDGLRRPNACLAEHLVATTGCVLRPLCACDAQKLTAFDRTDISYVRRTLAKISQASSDLASRLRVM